MLNSSVQMRKTNHFHPLRDRAPQQWKPRTADVTNALKSAQGSGYTKSAPYRGAKKEKSPVFFIILRGKLWLPVKRFVPGSGLSSAPPVLRVLDL